MKQKDVKVGGIYLTYIGQDLAPVEVVSVVPGNPNSRWGDEKRTSYRVCREGSSDILPKRRSAAALRERRKEPQENPFGNKDNISEDMLIDD